MSQSWARNINPNDNLPMTFFTAPGASSTNIVMTVRSFRDLLGYNNGRLMACGSLWDLKAKGLGAGMVRVWLEKWDGV